MPDAVLGVSDVVGNKDLCPSGAFILAKKRGKNQILYIMGNFTG